MNQAAHTRHLVEAEEDVGEVRRAVAAAAATVPGLVPGDAELVATELATNIWRHSRGGYLLHRAGCDGLELIAVDHGGRTTQTPHSYLPPHGLPWPSRHPLLRSDGAGGLGVGLAAVKRRSATLDWYTGPAGTVVLAELHATPADRGVADRHASKASAWQWGAIGVPYFGTGDSGDAWAVVEDGERIAVLVVDGLGHGPEAARAARAATTAFTGTHPNKLTPERMPDLVRELHQAMIGTRGAVLGVSLLDQSNGQAVFTGVGNITGRVVTAGTTHHLLGHPGMLGTHMRPPQARTDTRAWSPGSWLVMASDGIRTQWDTSPYPGLLDHHPTVVAATLHRDLARGTDDATVLALKDLRSPCQADHTP
jgi:hypothetical protein